MYSQTNINFINKCISKIPPKKIYYNDNAFSLLLRPLEEKDAEIINSAIVFSINNLKPFMDWSHKELSLEKQIDRIQISKEMYISRREYDFAVFDQSTEDFLMSATLGPSRTLNQKALRIGYWTNFTYCNRGLATIITKILTYLAFEVMGCDRVEIGCSKANKKSLRVIEKCNFRFEGEARNYFMEPSIEMLNSGYVSERTCLQYALVTEDIPDISWYKDIGSKITVEYT